jgi:hypothetical protein
VIVRFAIALTLPLAIACGNGEPTSVGVGWGKGGGGSAALDAGGFAGAASGGADCGGAPCADHRGTRAFVEPGTPADVPALFAVGALQEPGSEPAIVYPNHETLFPINVRRIRHEWQAGSSGVFKLVFDGPNTRVIVFTNRTDWEPSEEQWDWIAESNRGASVSWHVEGLDVAGNGDVWQSRPISLSFSEAAVEGAIYYWSTGTESVMRALVSSSMPEKFYTPPDSAEAGTCVACHTLSRDGKRLAVGFGGERLRQVSVPERETLLPGTGEEERPSAWTTFSPDASKLLVAAAGQLTLIDSTTGAPIGPDGGLVPTPADAFATHPDWSALGDRVAITLATDGSNKSVEGGSIALLPYADGAWGEPTVLVQSTGLTDNNFFPVFSPDSRFIAYVNAQAKSKDAVSAVLRLVRLNGRVNNQDAVLGVGNSMPTWAPSTRAGTFWLAFSSLRAYASLRAQDPKEDQIWIAAIDPELPDPGYPAFWAPFQSIDEGNHRAFWTHSGEDTQCSCYEACGDGIDNDCDGSADESGCLTCESSEICGDGIDNDCDCVVDDCNDEVCGDGIDNDADGLTDADDPVCQVR